VDEPILNFDTLVRFVFMYFRLKITSFSKIHKILKITHRRVVDPLFVWLREHSPKVLIMQGLSLKLGGL